MDGDTEIVEWRLGDVTTFLNGTSSEISVFGLHPLEIVVSRGNARPTDGVSPTSIWHAMLSCQSQKDSLRPDSREELRMVHCDVDQPTQQSPSATQLRPNPRALKDTGRTE